MSKPGLQLWSSGSAFYLGSVGAAVGLGSIWRFPYLAGTGGGGAFIIAFCLACLLIATPLLIAEFAIGRAARCSPTSAAGEAAAGAGESRRWNVVGILGTGASFIILSYYTVIAGWVCAYAWKCATGLLATMEPGAISQQWQDFVADPVAMGCWHLGFLAVVSLISSRGLQGGLEVVSRWSAHAMLLLLLVLTAFSLTTGDVEQGLRFAFAPDLRAVNAEVVLSAIGQAFFATGVGMAIMIAYGAYARPETSLVHSAGIVTGSILLVSLIASLIVFPLVFRYGIDPAQGPQLVFEVLPTAFAVMPFGRVFGTLFFMLLVLAALTPSIASLEPAVAWLQQLRLRRASATIIAATSSWILGIGSLLSFNVWKLWTPLPWIAPLKDRNFFEVADFVASNILLPIGALLTCALVGWRIGPALFEKELPHSHSRLRVCILALLKYVCPLAIGVVLVATLGD